MIRLVRNTVAASSMGLALAVAAPASAAPNASVEGVSDGALRGQLLQAIGDARSPPASPMEARRRARQAAKDAVALLRSEGYYDGEAEPDMPAATATRAVVKVIPGRRYRIIEPTITWSGAPPDAAAAEAARKALDLTPGQPGRAADILAAEGRLIAALQKRGYAAAAIRPRQVVVDHLGQTARPTLSAAAGAKATLGPVRLERHGRTKEAWVARLAPWKRGATYDPALLARLEKRLVDTGAFDSATVGLDPAAPAAGGDSAVEVTLLERKPRTLELGAGYSTTEGSGADAKWTFYNRLGVADSTIFTAKAYDIQQKLDAELDLPDWLRPDQTLKVGGGFLREHTKAYDDIGGGLRAEVVRRWSRATAFTVGTTFDYASTTEKTAENLLATPVGETLDLFILTLKTNLVLDRSNSILNPTRGWRLDAEADPTWITGGRTLGYVKTVVQLSGYLPVGGLGTVLAARVRLGSILGGAIPAVPADRRFFAGGGGSVRGYGYQAVGPHLSDGTPVGGVSLTEGSFEVRQSVGGGWGVVLFADAGGVGSSASPQFNGLSFGAGAGVRYDLGFGPLRLDIGTPINGHKGDSPVQVYISIGQSF